MDYYAILQIAPSADFKLLKRAYYRRARACHPDLFDGAVAKEEEFKHLVEAFNVLSDPVQRSHYDLKRAALDERVAAPKVELSREDEDAILDTFADDILEELIVGNTVPKNTCLKTLLLDLERTHRFCLFREGKNHYYAGQAAAAVAVFRFYLEDSPDNILARYFLGRSYLQLGKWRKAEKEFTAALRIGERRQPMLRLSRIRRELEGLRKKRLGFLGRWRAALDGPAEREDIPPGEQMRREVGRAMTRMETARRREGRPRLSGRGAGDE